MIQAKNQSVWDLKSPIQRFKKIPQTDFKKFLIPARNFRKNMFSKLNLAEPLERVLFYERSRKDNTLRGHSGSAPAKELRLQIFI